MTKVPEWARGITWYQIFPERFANGDPSNDPTADKVLGNFNPKAESWTITPWTAGWFSRSNFERKFSNSFRGSIFTRRYGGDLQGIIDHLDYIQDLGIGGIYLTPVFEATSLHKYDASMYHHIDINFGPDPANDKQMMERENPGDPATWSFTKADKLFLRLIKLVHERGMHIIIDGVFNHTGVQFWAFQDIVKNGKKSSFIDWYKIRAFHRTRINGFKFSFDSWWNLNTLPLLNRDERNMHPAPKKHIFDISKRWMDPDGDGDPENGIDGWRLDVARDLPIGFWREWSNHVKSINPGAFLAGELWEISPDFISTCGPFDSLQNYDFTRAINDFFVARKNKVLPSKFINALQAIYRAYPDNQDVLLNLLDSHDVERVASWIINPDREFNADRDERNPAYNPRKPTKEEYEVVKLVVAFQMTCKGAPVIYYGDEVGMWGAHDPHCRKPMVWPGLKYDDEVIDEQSGFQSGHGRYTVELNDDLHAFYKRIVSVRNQSNALKVGGMTFLRTDDEVSGVAFERRCDPDIVVACFNPGNKPLVLALQDYPPLVDVMTGTRVEQTKPATRITIPARKFAIFRAKNEK
nr:glycoside hydrolase family 13 protein [Candidatus Sigynarchaeota archaeon]